MAPAHRIWIGYATDPGSYAALTSARRLWGDGVHITAADNLPAVECTAALLADAYVRLPEAYEDGFDGALLEAVAGAELFLSTLEPEIAKVARLRESGRWPEGTRALVPGAQAAALCSDKLMLGQLLEAVGLIAPATTTADEAEWDERGIVLKRRNGWGSLGLQILEDEASFDAALAAPGMNLIAQLRLDGPELTIDAFRAADGRTRAVARERLHTSGGVCTCARVFEDAELEGTAATIGAALGLTGVFCFQVMGPERAITDVNPRPGAGTALSIAAGFDPIAAALADAFGEDPWVHVEPLAGERHVTRAYAEFVH